MRRYLAALGLCFVLVASAHAQRPAYNPYAKQTEEDLAAVRPDGKLNWPAFFKSKAMEDRFKVYFAQGSCTGTNMRIVNALEANKVVVNDLPEESFLGLAGKVSAGTVAMASEKGVPMMVVTHPAGVSKVSISGKMNPADLRPGMMVKFSGRVDNHGKGVKPIDSLEIFTPDAKFKWKAIITDRQQNIAATVLNNQPKGPNGRPILPNGVTAFILPDRVRLPTTDSWNLTLQRQTVGGIAVEAAYVGTKGTHVFAGFGGDYDFNQATLVGYPTLTTNQRKPFFNKFGWAQNFRFYGSDASNNFHSLQLKAEKRFSTSYSLLTHYTWSRSFHYTGTYYNQDAKQAYGPNDNHRSHVFTLAGVWEVPFGKGRKFLSNTGKAVDAVLGGWQLSTI